MMQPSFICANGRFEDDYGLQVQYVVPASISHHSVDSL